MGFLAGKKLLITGVLSNRSIRRYLGEVSPGLLLETAMPDVQRYLKLRAM